MKNLILFKCYYHSSTCLFKTVLYHTNTEHSLAGCCPQSLTTSPHHVILVFGRFVPNVLVSKIVRVLCYRLYGQQQIFSIGHLIWERTETSLEDLPGFTLVGLDIRECVWPRPRSRLAMCSTDVGLRLRLTSGGKDKGGTAYRGPGIYSTKYIKKYRLRLTEREELGVRDNSK